MKFWKNKKVFLTGHTGFKGSWMTIMLEMFGAKLTGYSLKPNTKPSLFEEAKAYKNINSIIGDILDESKLSKSIFNAQPEIIIHMAAQPLVRHSYENPKETYMTNVIGTLNILETARRCKSVKSIIVVTTDKCYENTNKRSGYKENDPMGGYDPYSSSKGCCELLVSSYRRSYFSTKNTPNLASVRAGNVIGGGDWADDRLIPDILRSFQNNQKVIIRNPNAVRPWQHVIELLYGYLILTEKLYHKGEDFDSGWNFGPDQKNCKTVKWIIEKMISHWDKNILWKEDENSNPHEAEFLMLNNKKAKKELGWIPSLDLNQSLKLTVDWHKEWVSKNNISELCKKQIIEYLKDK